MQVFFPQKQVIRMLRKWHMIYFTKKQDDESIYNKLIIISIKSIKADIFLLRQVHICVKKNRIISNPNPCLPHFFYLCRKEIIFSYGFFHNIINLNHLK
jgi:hypothetical protein